MFEWWSLDGHCLRTLSSPADCRPLMTNNSHSSAKMTRCVQVAWTIQNQMITVPLRAIEIHAILSMSDKLSIHCWSQVIFSSSWLFCHFCYFPFCTCTHEVAKIVTLRPHTWQLMQFISSWFHKFRPTRFKQKPSFLTDGHKIAPRLDNQTENLITTCRDQRFVTT